MRIDRRTWLRGAGAVFVVAAGGLVWRATEEGVLSPGQGAAYEPWATWRRDAADGPLALVRAAILAANPHNTQPWLFQVGASRVTLRADPARSLGAFDPYRREMHVGLGCALENMARAARAIGYEAAVTLAGGPLAGPASPPSPTPVATLDLTPARPRPDALFDAIGRRHTDRGAYDAGRPVPSEVLEAMWETFKEDLDVRLFLFTAPAERAQFGAAVVAATAAIVADAPMVADSQRWFRHRRADVERLRDGLTLDAAGLSPLVTAAAKILPPASPETSHRYWLDATRDVQVPTTPLFGFIATRELYDRGLALRAGRLWQRLHLLATSRGLAAQPINQPVEMVDRERVLGRPPHAAATLAALTGAPEWKPTFAFRVGFPTRRAGPSPRRPLESVLTP
jgi:nitroreductase